MSITPTSSRHGVAPLAESINGVARSFSGAQDGGVVVLRDIDLEIVAGEIVALIGPSGCGKSTLLRAVGGLDTPSAGQIRVGGTPVSGLDPRCAVGFQEPRLLPWRSVERNVAVGLPRATDVSRGRSRVAELIELVGLADSARLRPRQISGGMAQRVSLARALARDPGVLVLDEPFGALDALTRLRMHDLLLDVHAAEPTTILFVTHDVDEALYLADRVVLLGAEPSSGPGATIRRIVDVPGIRPRDRADIDLARLRAELLDGLGVDSHHLAA